VREAVAAAYAASVAAGAPLSQRAMAARFGISRRQVSQLTARPGGRMPAGAEAVA
jgi:DNA-binding transcriptional regulator LsrR (DeoR family)